jgi:hypothetical protein
VGYDSGVNNKEFIMTKSLYIFEQPFSGKAGGQTHLLGQARTVLKGELYV